MMTHKNEHADFLAHFPGESNELVEYARETVFLDSRYLFVWRVGRVQMAYCTHCHEEYPLGVGQASYKHNEKTTCLNCQSECKVKQNGRGRSKLIDDAYVVWYEKSLLNPQAVVATWYIAWRDYSGDYRNVETQFDPRARYYFEPGKGGRMFRPDWNGWKEMRSVFPLQTGGGWSYYKEVYCASENIEQAVSKSPLQYSMWKEYQTQTYTMVDFFNLAAKYPCVEYLTKMGLRNLVIDKLAGRKTYSVVNWRGKSIEKVLRMPRSDIRQLKNVQNIEPLSLHSYHYWRGKRGWEIPLWEAHMLRRLTDGDYYSKMLQEQEQFGTEVEIIKYLLKQLRRPDAPKTYSDATYVLTEWRDYLRSAKELGMDLTQSHVVFPNNLHLTHDKTTRKVKLKPDELINQRIAARVSVLERFSYRDEQYFIRPAKSSLELFDEGKVLQHCVGGYADRYAAGSTDLFVLRQVSDPDTPLCTVEVVEGKIRQARGFKNRTLTQQEQAFVDRFVKNLNRVIRQEKRAKKVLEQERIAG